MIGLTATPLTLGLDKIYSHLTNGVSTNKLIKEGHLAPLHVYAAREIDMEGAHKTAGEWQASEVRERGRKIIGNIVSEWVEKTNKHFGGPVKTLAFSADVAHGEEICEAFQKAGYDFRQTTYRDSYDETMDLIKGFRQGKYVGLVNSEKLVRGFDVPDILCMIGARPYSSSLAAVIQQLGRGMRAAPGKTFCIYLGSRRQLRGLGRADIHYMGERRIEVAGDAEEGRAPRATPGRRPAPGHHLPQVQDGVQPHCQTMPRLW